MASPPDPERLERRALLTSLVAMTLIGVGSIVWGILSGSRVILFDGVYTLAGILLVIVSLLAARLAAAGPTREYPFGRHAATPLAVALQGAALIATVAYGVVDALTVIVDGGSDTAPGSVLAYGVVTALASGIVMLILTRAARASALARAERVSWRAGMFLSGVIALGGGAAMALAAPDPASAAIGYIDPILVLIACAAVLPMALGLVREGVRELLEAAPDASLRERIDTAVRHGVASSLPAGRRLPEPIVRATTLGRRLYVEVDFIVGAQRWTVDEEDAVRRAVAERLDGLGFQVWATIELTTDPALAADWNANLVRRPADRMPEE